MIFKKHWFWLAVGLAALGIAGFAYKHFSLGFPLTPQDEAELWRVQLRVQATAGGGPLQATLQLPGQPPGFDILDENFISPDYGLTVDEKALDRVATWSIRRAWGTQSLYYRALISADDSVSGPDFQPQLAERPELEEPYATALRTIYENTREQSADIASFTTELLQELNSDDPEASFKLFADEIRDDRDRVETAILLLAGGRIPAQLVRAIRLADDQRQAEVRAWLAVHNEQQWLFFNPETGSVGIPDDLLIWWYGEENLVSITGGRLEEAVFSTRRAVMTQMELAERRAMAQDSLYSRLSLLSLPLQSQTLYAVLIMIPLGAFVIAILRNMVGVSSFGTFMPVLVALAFRETKLLAGILLFTVLISLGLAIRFYLERLKLLLVPRLSAVLIIVILLMAMVSVLTHQLGLEVGLSVALFPMVIVAMVIERMSIVWEERGAGDAIKEGAGSMVIAIIAYLVMGIDQLQYLFFVFPELLLVLLALTIAIGRYTGFRLTELIRFRTLLNNATGQ